MRRIYTFRHWCNDGVWEQVATAWERSSCQSGKRLQKLWVDYPCTADATGIGGLHRRLGELVHFILNQTPSLTCLHVEVMWFPDFPAFESTHMQVFAPLRNHPMLAFFRFQIHFFGSHIPENFSEDRLIHSLHEYLDDRIQVETIGDRHFVEFHMLES
jgi:hypothetical protein